MYIDLSMPIDKNDKYNPFFNNARGAEIAKLGHLGTHLDLMNSGVFNVERFFSRGVLVDVENIFGRHIEPEDFAEKTDIKKGDFVIFRTAWFEQYYESEFYLSGLADGRHPQLSALTLKYLTDKKINCIGIDAAGIKLPAAHKEADMFCASKNVYVVENMVNTKHLKNTEFNVYCFPLNLVDSSGLPVRVIAEI